MRSSDTDIMKITAGEVLLFCRVPPEDTETNGFEILSLAIDGEDNVYIFFTHSVTMFTTGSCLFMTQKETRNINIH